MSVLGRMPQDRRFTTVDERLVRAEAETVFRLAADVTAWPRYLRHYRYVRMLEPDASGLAVVEMSANRPFGSINWPTWWTSLMETPVDSGGRRSVRFRHIRGVTRGMDVEWTFTPGPGADTLVRIVHVWNGPGWPVIGAFAADAVIGPIFVHGIASRTLAGLATVAETTA